ADPKNPAGPALLGELQFRAGQYDAAEATLGKPPAVDSRIPEVHFFLGNISNARGQAGQAISHYQKSLAANGAYLPSRVALAEIFLQNNRLADAREDTRTPLDTQPNHDPP